jgi:hypothetical protein
VIKIPVTATKTLMRAMIASVDQPEGVEVAGLGCSGAAWTEIKSTGKARRSACRAIFRRHVIARVSCDKSYAEEWQQQVKR